MLGCVCVAQGQPGGEKGASFSVVMQQRPASIMFACSLARPHKARWPAGCQCSVSALNQLLDFSKLFAWKSIRKKKSTRSGTATLWPICTSNTMQQRPARSSAGGRQAARSLMVGVVLIALATALALTLLAPRQLEACRPSKDRARTLVNLLLNQNPELRSWFATSVSPAANNLNNNTDSQQQAATTLAATLDSQTTAASV